MNEALACCAAGDCRNRCDDLIYLNDKSPDLQILRIQCSNSELQTRIKSPVVLHYIQNPSPIDELTAEVQGPSEFHSWIRSLSYSNVSLLTSQFKSHLKYQT